ncbi:MAG: SpoIIE family protein phosphatase [Planctomycetaceae bacterium]
MAQPSDGTRMTRILLIDDDEESFLITRAMLSRFTESGFELDWVGTYEEGLEALRHPRHDAYLLDFRLGARDGLELLREVAAEGCQVPIILMTGQGDHAIDVQAMQIGAADFLAKGEVTPAILERSLRYAIERHRAMTVRLQDESQLRLFAEQAQAVLWTTDVELRFTSSWGAGLLSLDLQPNQVVGLSVGEYWAADKDRDPMVNAHRRALRGESVAGESRWAGKTFRTRVGPLRVGRQIVGTIGVALDITAAKQVEDEFDAARTIQEALIPKQAPALPGFDLAGVCHPAAATGGDYFDYMTMVDGSLGIVIADVSSHGFASALIMVATRRLLRTSAETQTDIGAILTAANRAIAEDTPLGRFVTLLFARIDPQTRTLSYAGAGHLGYVLDASGAVTILDSTSLPLGIDESTVVPNGDSITLAPGQILLLFTDGFPEAMSPQGELFGNARVLEVVQSHRDKAAREILEILFAEIRKFSHPAQLLDDATAVVLKVL